MLLQSYFPFPVLNRQTTFFQKSFHISWIYYLLSQRFLYLMTVKLPKVRNNLFEEISRQWDCIVSKNTCFQRIFMGIKKKSKEFLCVFLFFWVVFSIFRGLSNISLIRYFFVEAYPFKNICQMEIFINAYLPNCLITCLLNK